MSEFQERDLNQAEGVDLNQAEGVDLNQAEGIDLNQAEGVDLNHAEGVDLNQAEGVEVDPSKEGLNKEILEYIEINEESRGGWQADFKFAKELVKEGKLDLALKLALLAREAQIKEGSQKESPPEFSSNNI
jgi:hypothetical protein